LIGVSVEISSLSREQLAKAAPSHVFESGKKPLLSEIRRFLDEVADGPVDAWLLDSVIPPPTRGPISVCIVVVWVGTLPKYIDYFVRSIAYSASHGLCSASVHRNETDLHSGIDVLIFYTDGGTPRFQVPNVRFELITREEIYKRVTDAFEYATGEPQPGLSFIVDSLVRPDGCSIYTQSKGQALFQGPSWWHVCGLSVRVHTLGLE
jgi:hypothetical protein